MDTRKLWLDRIAWSANAAAILLVLAGWLFDTVEPWGMGAAYGVAVAGFGIGLCSWIRFRSSSAVGAMLLLGILCEALSILDEIISLIG